MIDSLTVFMAIFSSFIVGVLALKLLLKMLEKKLNHFLVFIVWELVFLQYFYRILNFY